MHLHTKAGSSLSMYEMRTLHSHSWEDVREHGSGGARSTPHKPAGHTLVMDHTADRTEGVLLDTALASQQGHALLRSNSHLACAPQGCNPCLKLSLHPPVKTGLAPPVKTGHCTPCSNWSLQPLLKLVTATLAQTGHSNLSCHAPCANATFL